MSKIKSILRRLLSRFLDEDINNKKQEKIPETNVFGDREELPMLDYAQMISLLRHHYLHEQKVHGHIIASEMIDRLSFMNHIEIKALFDAIVEIKIRHKDYIDSKHKRDKNSKKMTPHKHI